MTHAEGRTAWALLLAALTLPITACGDDEPQRASTSPPATSPASAPPSTPPASAPSSTPPQRPAALKAKNGSSLKACADAKCEVQIKPGDVIRFTGVGRSKAGFDDLKVTSVSQKELVYDLAHGAASLTQPARKTPSSSNINGISVTLVKVQGDHAVIRLGNPVPGAFSAQVGPGGGMSVTTPGG